jgi:hypothetical protein
MIGLGQSRAAAGSTSGMRIGVDDRDSIGRNGEMVDARLGGRCIDPPTVALRPTLEARSRRRGPEAFNNGFRPSACASRRWAGSRTAVDREVAFLPLPRVASGRLGLSQSAATFNPAVPDSGRFLRRLVERPREASATRLEARVEEWQSSATNADPKIGTQDAAVKRRRTRDVEPA